jgi:hypothetical protein
VAVPVHDTHEPRRYAAAAIKSNWQIQQAGAGGGHADHTQTACAYASCACARAPVFEGQEPVMLSCYKAMIVSF